MPESYGFIKLAYGKVSEYKDTSKMTPKEVVEEFMKHEGVSSADEYFEKSARNTYRNQREQVINNADNENTKARNQYQLASDIAFYIVPKGAAGRPVSFDNSSPKYAKQYHDAIVRGFEDFQIPKGIIHEIKETKRTDYAQYTNLVHIHGTPVSKKAGSKLSLEITLTLKPATNDEWINDFAAAEESGFHFKGMGKGVDIPAYHEMAHIASRVVQLLESNIMGADGKMRSITNEEFDVIEKGDASESIIKQAIDEVYGGDESKAYSSAEYLGSYAYTNHNEMLAQCCAYEYTGQTHPFSAKVKSILQNRLKEALK